MGLAERLVDEILKAEANQAPLLLELGALASEKRSDIRVELLRRITDLYLASPGGQGEIEQYLLDDILTRIVGGIERRDKPLLSANLARLPSLPDEVARPLVTDRDIKIAGPILRGSVDISETVLLDAAEHGSQAHLRAIAERASVTPPVSDVLVERGNRTVMHTLVANSGAQFSDGGMRRLVSRAEDDPNLQKLLVERPDVSDEAVAQLMPLVMKGVAARAGGETENVDTQAVRQFLSEWLRNRRLNLAEMETCIKLVRDGRFSLADAAWQFIGAKRLLDAASVLAASVNLDRDHAESVLTLGQTSSALLVLRSLELDWPLVAAFLALRYDKLKVLWTLI